MLAKELPIAQEQLAVILQLDLEIPLADDKVEGPVLALVYLGIPINSMEMSVEVPNEKLTATMFLLTAWGSRRTCTKRQLKSLIGKLGHISKLLGQVECSVGA